MSALSELRPVSEVSSEQRLRVRDVLKRALEGELIELAVAPKAEEQAADFSKSSSHYHSKGGHCFSKFSLDRDIATASAEGAAQNAAYAQFAAELLANRS